jgi:hypothetical protein
MDYARFNPLKPGYVKQDSDGACRSILHSIRQGGLPDDWAAEVDVTVMAGKGDEVGGRFAHPDRVSMRAGEAPDDQLSGLLVTALDWRMRPTETIDILFQSTCRTRRKEISVITLARRALCYRLRWLSLSSPGNAPLRLPWQTLKLFLFS